MDAGRGMWMIRCLVGALACALVLAHSPPASADPATEAFIARFTGTWTGGGSFMETGMEQPQRVTCRLEGRGGLSGFSMAGRCRRLVASRAVVALVAYDPASGEFRGTYEGSRAGTAQLAGRRHGDALQLALVWPRPVHGDPRGRMNIVNRGDGALRIVVEHPYGPAAAAGHVIRSADLVLTRQ